jgi:CotS family spore coat protein
MDGLVSDYINGVLACFGLKSQRLTKEKGSYFCNTEMGFIKLAKTNETVQAIGFSHAVKEHVALSGFERTDRYILTPEGLPYVQMGLERYIATQITQGRELDFTSQEDVLNAVSLIADFHVAAKGIKAEGTKTLPLFEEYRQGKDLLKQVIKQINRQKQRSDFDITLIKNAPVYEERINQALSLLTAVSYNPMYTLAIKENHVTHNAIKEEYIRFPNKNGGESFLYHFTQAKKNVQLYDVAVFIRRYTIKNRNHILPLPLLLETYNKNNPQPDGAEAVLRAMLLYPAFFMKIVEEYYTRKRNWIPGGLYKRLEEVLTLEY